MYPVAWGGLRRGLCQLGEATDRKSREGRELRTDSSKAAAETESLQFDQQQKEGGPRQLSHFIARSAREPRGRVQVRNG